MAPLCCIIVLIVLIFGNQLDSRSAAENTPQTVILNDIRNAFKIITNDSQLLDHIIPEMYSSIMMNPNLTFAFKMPNKLLPEGFEMLKMKRNDFVEPIFPNVSTNNVIDQHVGDPNVKMSEITDWSSFGLPGWTGSLTLPIPAVEQNHKDEDWMEDVYPRDEILLDIKQNNFNGRVQNVKIITENDAPIANEKADNEGVYIARVNDPFGYSVQWNFKNATESPTDGPRNKRDVAKLYSMIKCSTGCDPLIFKGYGCYCGFGGHGIPADGIDRCCKLHDKCYGHSNCISYLEYFVPYVWKCYRGKPLCAIDHGEWGGPDSCAARLCQCDLRLSRCLRRHRCPLQRAVCRSSPARRLQNLIYFD